MSPGGYEASPLPSLSSHNDSRRTSGPLSSGYDRPLNPPPRRRSPSPGPSRRYNPYDSYIPPRSAPAYRDDYPNVYRPNIYRPDQSSIYYSRTPSPDRYVPPRSLEIDTWDRSTWQAPIRPPVWPERKPAPPSPTSSVSRDRTRRDSMLATRMFEPSDTWKQTHVDRPLRIDTSRPSSNVDRYPDYRGRDVDISPDRVSRGDRTPPRYPGGDRYRPGQNYRDPYTTPRSDYDSYRPQYEDGWAHLPARDSTGLVDSFRRDSIAVPHSRSSSHNNSNGRRVSDPISFTGSISPRSRPRSPPYLSRHTYPVRSPSRGRALASRSDHNDNDKQHRPSMDLVEPTSKKLSSRSSSRSSIASTHVSVLSPPRPPSSHLPQLEKPAFEVIQPVVINGTTTHDKVLERTYSPPCPPKSNFAITNDLPQDSMADAVKSNDTASTSCPGSPAFPQKRLKRDSFSSTETLPVQPVSAFPKEESVIAPHGVPNSPPSVATRVDIVTSTYTLPKSTTVRQTPELCDPSAPSNSSPSSTQRVDNFTSLTASLHAHHIPQPSPSPSGVASAIIDTSRGLPSSPIHLIPKAGLVIGIAAKDTLPILAEPLATSEALRVPAPIVKVQEFPEQVATTSAIALEDIPKLSEAKSKTEAFRIVVRTRLLCDHQTREERTNPVLLANRALASPAESRGFTTPEELVDEVYEGQRLETRMNSFALSKQSLVQRFEEHQAAVAEKAQRLREEYLELHERWLAHCAALNEQSKPNPSQTEAVQPAGRTTRRSTANLGDAVRSDLEMEQIIASLGNDEATDPNHLSAKNVATIPDMISVTHGRVEYLFDDTNRLVEDPHAYYAPHTGIHDWTEPEKEIFLDKYAAHPKQFGLVADHLTNKTASQCVDYYYLHKKKLIDFRKVISQYAPNKRRRRATGKKKGNGLLEDIRQHDAEVHRESPSPSLTGRTTRGRKGMPPPESKKPVSTRRATVQLEGTPTSTPTPEPEGRPRRRRTAAPPSRTVSVSLDDGEEEGTDAEPRPTKRAKRVRKTKSAVLVVDESISMIETRFIDQSESLSRRKSQSVIVQWSEEDKALFLNLLKQYGDDFKRIAASMPNKTTIQVSNYYRSNLVDMNLAKVAASAPKRSPTPELREAPKDTPYPGSGIMSPVTGATPDLVIPVSSLNFASAHTNTGASPPTQTHDSFRHPPHDIDAKPFTTPWVSLTSRDISTPTMRSGVLGPSKSAEYMNPAPHPLSPNHSRPYPANAYPTVPARPISGHFVPVSPSFTPPSAHSYAYPPYADPQYPAYDTRVNQRLSASHPFPESHVPPSRRPATVPSIQRGENPYPVLPTTGSAITPSFFP